MNFLEIINKCLVELNYKKVNAFTELTKNEHKKIINILNILNAEICTYTKWNFLIRKNVLTLPAGCAEIDNNINGRISQLIIDGIPFEFYENAGDILVGKIKNKNFFSTYDKKLIFAKTFDEDKKIEIIYYTYNNTIDNTGKEKRAFENATDETLIPMPFAEPILVYGTCMKLKGNPQHIRFSYWTTMYKDALSNMISKCSLDVNFSPSIKLSRI